jgi:hypothetical protein
LYSPVHSHSFTARGLVSALACAGFKLVRDFNALHYNVMIFEAAPPARKPSGGEDVLREVRRFFAFDRHRYGSADVLMQTSTTLGSWTAVYRYCGSPFDGRQIARDRLDWLPVVVETPFREPQALYK